jgi:hypothetical protein
MCRRESEYRPTTAEGVSIDVTGFTPVTAFSAFSYSTRALKPQAALSRTSSNG